MQVYASAPVLRAPSLPVSGRLGEKRSWVDDDARRRAGRVVPERDEDVFGGVSRASSVRPREVSRTSSVAPSAGDERPNKRARVAESKQVVDNKGVS